MLPILKKQKQVYLIQQQIILIFTLKHKFSVTENGVNDSKWLLYLHERITECQGLEGSSQNHQVQPPINKSNPNTYLFLLGNYSILKKIRFKCQVERILNSSPQMSQECKHLTADRNKINNNKKEPFAE